MHIQTLSFQQLKRGLKTRQDKFGTPWTEQELVKLYSQQGRFKGRILVVVDAIGQKKLQSVIQSRINEETIDRVSQVLTTNFCENFFMILTKYSEGKRLNFNQKDTWKNFQIYVAGITSTEDGHDFKSSFFSGVFTCPFLVTLLNVHFSFLIWKYIHSRKIDDLKS